MGHFPPFTLWGLRSKVQVKPRKLRSRIFRKQFEIEINCQKKFDRKSCMSFWMVKMFLTSGKHQRSKIKVEPLKILKSNISKTERVREIVSMEVR